MGLSFLRGILAAVNPCGFVLLPTYLMFFLGMQGHRPGSQRASVRRGLIVSAALTSGFVTVFMIAGLVHYHFTTWITANVKYATVVIGVGFVVLGIAMLFGLKLPMSTPRLEAGGRSGGIGSMFLFGVTYAVASIGCTMPLFLVTLFSVRREGVVAGVAEVAAYGLGMGLLVTALTVSLALAHTGMLGVLRGVMQHIQQIAGTFVLLSGLYLVYYFWVVDLNEQRDPITSRVERFQTWVVNELADRWQLVGIVLAVIVVAAIVYVVRGRDELGPPDEPIDAELTGTPSPSPRP